MMLLTEQQKTDWKQQLKDACITVLQDRIKTAEQAMEAAQDAANSDEKSSAGDKYETTRAMAHIEREMNARQLHEARREMEALLVLNVSSLYTQVTTGAVVVSKDQVYFIALGLGRTTINNQKITFLSPQAPLAVLMHLKKAGDTFLLNDVPQEIIEVF